MKTTIKRLFTKVSAAFMSAALLLGGGVSILPQVVQSGIVAEAASLSENENNDSMSSANSINPGDTINASITDDDEKDFYKVVLPSSGELTIKITAYFSELRFWVYNADGDCIYDKGGDCSWEYFHWNSTAEVLKETVILDLTSGTYFICFGKCWDSTGDYNFTTSFETAGESFKETGYGNDNTMNTSRSVSVGKTYKGQIADNDEKDFYKFSIESSGRITIDFEAYIPDLKFWVYNEEGDCIYDKGGDCSWERFQWNSTAEVMKETISLDLTSGTYFICFGRVDGSTGNYNFTTSFETAGESFKETGYGNDNTMNTSRSISAGVTYKGQLAENDEKDFYKFSMPSQGKITISFIAYFSDMCFWVYDENGECIYSKGGSCSWEHFQWDSVTCKIEQDIELDLTKGTYYVCFGKCTTGNYSFTVKTPFASKPVSINRSSATLGVGETITVKANQNVSWKSSNTRVATVSGGKITAKGIGTAKITARNASGKYATCEITVKKAAAKITLNKTTLKLGVGETFKFISYVKDGASFKRTFTSSNKSVLKITSTTSRGITVRALRAGTSTITVKTYNGKTVRCKVTVKKAAAAVSLKPAAYTLKVGQTLKITSAVSRGASYHRYFSSTDTKKAKIISKNTSTCTIKAVSAGTCYIKVKTFNGKTARCKLTIKR